MSTIRFRDWIISNTPNDDDIERELKQNIQLEKIIEEEKKARKPRRSKRIEEQRREKELNQEYAAYLNTLDK